MPETRQRPLQGVSGEEDARALQEDDDGVLAVSRRVDQSNHVAPIRVDEVGGERETRQRHALGGRRGAGSPVPPSWAAKSPGHESWATISSPAKAAFP